jgi:hypothetical protein
MAESNALPLAHAGTHAMRRYFFHVDRRSRPPDDEGTILADVAAARAEAITTAGALLKDRGATFWGVGE